MPSFESQKIVTNNFRSLTIDQLIADASSSNTSGLYMYTGRPTTWTGSDANVAAPVDTVGGTITEFQNMVFGKKIQTADISHMIKRYDWTANTIYTAYAEDNAQLFAEQFYVVVNGGSQYDVFKCLSNNSGARSVNAPAYSDTFPADTFYQTADGYQWKYMYSFTTANFTKFATAGFIPVNTNANVSANAIAGAIDVIRVDNAGAQYDNYGAGQFISADIQVGGIGTIYAVTNASSSLDNFYNSSYLLISEGTGKGQYRTITDYNIVGMSKLATLDSPFTVIPDVTSQWEISPSILIIGDGKQSTNCAARALINTASTNSVYAVEMLDRGVGYRFATATVSPSPTAVIANTATLHVVIPPPGGHGFDPVSELGGTRVGISVTFANSEANTISTSNQYRTIGIVKDPQFANVQVFVLDSGSNPGSNGTFITDETIYQISPTVLTGTVSINTTSAILTGTGTVFTPALIAGDMVFCNSGASSQLSTVVGVTNTSLTISSNGLFLANAATVSLAKVTNRAIVKGIAVGELHMTNVAGPFIAQTMLVGGLSHATAFVNNYTVSGFTKTMNTFSQLNGYIGTFATGAFTADELVRQSDITGVIATGYFHSTTTVGGTTTVFLYAETGIFNTSASFTGVTSGATFNILNKYEGDLVVDSGKIVYLENFQPISRAANQSELAKVIIEY